MNGMCVAPVRRGNHGPSPGGTRGAPAAGIGELPLAENISAVPAGVPLSVETPNLALLESLGAIEFARRARRR